MFLLNAYLDVRKAAKTPNVRILGMDWWSWWSRWCQSWNEGADLNGANHDGAVHGDNYGGVVYDDSDDFLFIAYIFREYKLYTSFCEIFYFTGDIFINLFFFV